MSGLEASMVRPLHVRVKLFAVAADRAGTREATIVLEGGPDGAVTVGAVRSELAVRFPGLADLLDVCALAVNAAYAEEGDPVPDGSEVAVIPPVSGGSDGSDGQAATKEARRTSVGRARVSRIALDPTRLAAEVEHPGAGAVVVFLGTVRDSADGHVTEALTYEAYEALATREMERILSEIAAGRPGIRITAEHRVGDLQVGETAVVVAASAPHREEAFAACRAAIDRIKTEVPIWKQEVGPEGRRWTEGTPVVR